MNHLCQLNLLHHMNHTSKEYLPDINYLSQINNLSHVKSIVFLPPAVLTRQCFHLYGHVTLVWQREGDWSPSSQAHVPVECGWVWGRVWVGVGDGMGGCGEGLIVVTRAPNGGDHSLFENLRPTIQLRECPGVLPLTRLPSS